MIVKASGMIGYGVRFAYRFANINYWLVLVLFPNNQFNNIVADKDIIFFGEGDVVDFINKL